MDMKNAIRNGDGVVLRRLLAEDPSRANTLIYWGKNDSCLTHPLHFVSDMLFDHSLPRGMEMPLVEALLLAGADPDFQRDGKGDTPLIGAASLGAEEVGLRLLDAGANRQLLGLFGETALHWAAMLGEESLTRGLIDGSDLNLPDARYHSSPLGWAFHGWEDPPAGDQGGQRSIILLLVAAGATVDPAWMESEKVRNDPQFLAALRSGGAARRPVAPAA